MSVRYDLLRDTFDREDGYLSDSSPNWTDEEAFDRFYIRDNKVGPFNTEAIFVGAYTSAGEPGENQWVEIKLGALPEIGDEIMALMKMRELGQAYTLRLTASYVHVTNAGSSDTIIEHDVAPLVTDIFRLEWEDNNVRLFKNNVSVGTATDSLYADVSTSPIMYSIRPIGSAVTTGTYDTFAYGGFTEGLAITGVNDGTDTVVSTQEISITGSALNTVTSATLTDGTDPITLVITEQDPERMVFTPVNVTATKIALNSAISSAVKITVNDGTTTVERNVAFLPAPGEQFVDIASMGAYLSTGITSAANGDQLITEQQVGDTRITLQANSDATYTPAFPIGAHTRRWYLRGTKVWDSGTVNITTEQTFPPSWSGNVTPQNGQRGQAYNYTVSSLVTGTVPITFTMAQGTLPPGLTLSTAGVISGTPTAAGSTGNLQIRATNAQGNADSNVFSITIDEVVLSNIEVTGIQQTQATIALDCNTNTGTLYYAIRESGEYGPGDISAIINGTNAVWSTNHTPTNGRNNRTATGLRTARTQYVGVVHGLSSTYSNVLSATFQTLAYPEGPAAPTKCQQYPDIYIYRDLATTFNLKHGWCGDEPITLVATSNPVVPGLTMDTNGVVTGTPTDLGTFRANVTATNPHGTAFDSFNIIVQAIQPPTPSGWTRAELVESCMAYVDRANDVTIRAQISNMIRYAEDRMSRIMRNRQMSERYAFPLVNGQEYYPLPGDFAGMRDIQLNLPNGQIVSITYLNPEQANNVQNKSSGLYYYTIIANRIQLVPTSPDGEMEIVYYRRIDPLVEDADSNWVLQYHRDIYKTAVLAEIENFTKNDERAAMFWASLETMFSEIESRDDKDRWSGAALSVNTETPTHGFREY